MIEQYVTTYHTTMVAIKYIIYKDIRSTGRPSPINTPLGIIGFHQNYSARTFTFPLFCDIPYNF